MLVPGVREEIVHGLITARRRLSLLTWHNPAFRASPSTSGGSNRGRAAAVGNGPVGGGGVSTSLLDHAFALRALGFSIIPIPRAAGGLDGRRRSKEQFEKQVEPLAD
jgi:hypothetical protein